MVALFNNRKLRTQDYFSLGYVYLILLGIARESLYYGILGINIVEFSTITDILLSPIAYLTKHPIVLLILLLMLSWLYVQPKLDKKYKNKNWYKKLYQYQKQDSNVNESDNQTRVLYFVMLMVTTFFLGTAIGAGVKANQRMMEKNFKSSDFIEFKDMGRLEGKIMGQNSAFVFFVKKDDVHVSVCPINENIVWIEQH